MPSTRRDCLRALGTGLLGAALPGCAALPSGGAPATPTAIGLRRAANYSAGRGEVCLFIAGPGLATLQRGNFGQREPVYSITKSLGAIAVLAAVEAGYLPLDQVIPQPIGVAQAITTRQLLGQSSGLERGTTSLYRARPQNLRAAAWQVPLVHRPGSRFDYGPSHYERLAAVLDLALPAPWSADAWLEQQVVRRLGLEPGQEWRQDARGQLYWSTGIELHGNDLLRLGRWLQHGAQVPGLGPPVSRALMEEAFDEGAGSPIYGLGFWRNANAGNSGALTIDSEESIGRLDASDWRRARLSARATTDLRACIGSAGQRVYFEPGAGLLVVRVGRGSGFRDPDFLDALYSG